MALFGNGLRDTRTEDQKRREAMAMGIDPVTFERMNQMPAPEMNIGIDTGGPAQAPQRQPGFWNGGDKFSARDGIAAALAAIGDAFAQRGGGQGGAVDMLTGGRMNAMKLARDAQQRQQERQEGLQDYRSKAEIDAEFAPAPKAPAMQQNYEWWKGLPATEQAKFGAYQSIVNPKWQTGADGVPRQMTGGGLPQGFDPNEWEVVDEGGQTGAPSGDFRYRR